MRELKLVLIFAFGVLFVFVLAGETRFSPSAAAYSTGPPAGRTGAPGEVTCIECHNSYLAERYLSAAGGTRPLTIIAPATYTPGQTYQITVRHMSTDPSRRRWGFQMTALAGTAMAGTFANINATTQIISGGSRSYIEHTLDGTFPEQMGGAQWTVNWTAPATSVGPIKFYAAGNQADNSGTPDGDFISTANATSQPAAQQAPRSAPFDFDGDQKTDVAVFRPGASGAEWWILRSGMSSVYAAQFGASTDAAVPADFTGDGKADVAFWRPSNGQWFVLRSEDSSFFAFPFGASGDIPAPADYDGDGKADPAVYRPSAGVWFILRSSDGQVASVTFGISQDKPVPQDFDGDGKADIGVYRPNGSSGAEWWILRSTAGLFAASFGQSTDKAVAGDYTGDGKADVAFWRPSTGEWYVMRSEDSSFFAFPFGTSGDVAAPGDFDGDGKMDAAVFRPSNSTWFVNKSTGGVQITPFGTNGDVPVPSLAVR
ncbi:MAG: choice-of-anchor V domain-containing protein [Pyrinomonadaceae bacterium]